jgi:hypothetical protein
LDAPTRAVLSPHAELSVPAPLMHAGLMGISAVDNTNNTLSETTDVAANFNDLNIAPEHLKAPTAAPAAADLPAPAFSFADAKLVNGNQAELTFTDGTSWLFHTAWLHDSCRGPGGIPRGGGYVQIRPRSGRTPWGFAVKVDDFHRTRGGCPRVELGWRAI